MPSSFFEKLKKGMDIKKIPEIKEDDDIEEIESSPDLTVPEDSPETSSPPLSAEQEKAEEISNPEEIPLDDSPKIEKASIIEKPIKEKPLSATAATISAPAEKPETAPATTRRRKTRKKSTAKSTKERVKKIKVKEKEEEEETKIKKEEEWSESEGQLVIDVYQTDKDVIIQSAVAGVKPEDLNISIENDMVKIKGVREKIFEEKNKDYFYQECFWGNFSREVILPVEVDGSKAEATMENGILTIKIPKVEREGRKKITVKEQ